MAVVPHSIFSTNDLPERDRFDAWRTLFRGHDIDADPLGFSGRVETTQIGPMLLHVMNSSPQSTSRTRSRIRQDGQERFTLLLSRHAYRIESDSGSGEVSAGAISINDMSQPYKRSRACESNSIIMSIARDSIARLIPNEELLHGMILAESATQILGEYLRNLVVHRHAIDMRQAPDVAQATLHLLVASARPNRDRIAQASGPANVARLSAVKRYIRLNLAEPLTVEQIAATLGLSRSRLYSLFEPEGGVARYLMQQRLAAIKAALDDPQDMRNIGAIGAAYGFTDPSHFSRAFRHAYGQSPRSYRASSEALVEPSTQDRPTVATWMQSLG